MTKKINFFKTKKLLTIALLFLWTVAFTQAPAIQWQVRHGGTNPDYFNDIIKTSDGGSISIGTSASSNTGNVTSAGHGSNDVWIVKSSADGTKQWEKLYGGSSYDEGTSIRQTSDGGYIFAAHTSSSQSGNITGTNHSSDLDVWVVKLDASGNIIWNKLYGGIGTDAGFMIEQTSDGGYILGGQSIGSSNTGDIPNDPNGVWNEAGLAIKLDSSGNKTWIKAYSYNTTSSSWIFSIKPVSGGYVFAGVNDDSANANGNDAWVVRIDTAGTVVWNKRYGGSLSDGALDILQTSDGGYLFAGRTKSSANGDVTGTNNGVQDGWIVKIDANGNRTSNKLFGGSAEDAFSKIKQTSDGGYILAGWSYSSLSGDVSCVNRGDSDIWMMKMDASYNRQWSKLLGGSAYEFPGGLDIVNDGSYLVNAETDSSTSGDLTTPTFGGGSDGWIVKLNGTTVFPAPTITTTSASCSAAGTATITNYNANYTYTFSPAGPTIGTGGTISGITAGTSYTVTATSGTCTSTTSASFSIAAQLSPCPFTCNTNFYLSQYPAGGPTTLYELDNTTNPFTITPIGTSPAGYTVNGIGYNTIDNLIYGIWNDGTANPNPNHLIQIGAGGTMTDLGIITGLPGVGYNNGTFDNNGNLYTTRYGTANMYKINITTRTATAITLSRTVQTNDLVYDKTAGRFFGYEGTAGTNRLISINPSTGAVTNIGGTSGLLNGTLMGALFIDANGDIFGNADDGTGFYQFDRTTGHAVKISSSVNAFGNDGANCPDAIITFPADLSVTKTDNFTEYVSGTTTTYTIVVSNSSGAYGVLGATVSDSLPAGIPAANMSYSVPVLTGGATTSITGPQTGALNDVVSLPIGATITYTVTVNIPAAFTGNLTNTVTVTPPVSSTDPDMSNNTATDTDTQHILPCDPVNLKERITNGVFPTSPAGDTNSITGWTVGGTAAGSRIRVSATGIKFWKDASTTTTLTQTLTNVAGGSIIQMKNAYWTKTPQNGATAHSTFTVSYAGVIYATINIAGTNPTITGQNGALAFPLSMPAISAAAPADSTPIDISIYLPSVLPSTGDLILTLTAGSAATEARDFGLSAISLKSCEFYCTKPGDFTSGGVPTKVGITNQTKLVGWPQSIPNGHITLESKDKGFVITRVNNATDVADPKEGMMVYDITAQCVKLYNGTGWKCIQRSCND